MPDLQRTVRGSHYKVIIGRQQRQFVTHAQLGEQGIDGANLQPGATAAVPQSRGVDMILPTWRDERQCRELLDDRFPRARTRESLQKLLQDKSCGQDHLVAPQGVAQEPDVRSTGVRVAPQGKRPDASVDEQAHLRVRSAL
jgi:hypothetical protein